MEEIKLYGYMRVSSREQNEDRQRIALLEMGVPEKNIFMDNNENLPLQNRKIPQNK